jgi:hypothetical protein
MANPMEALQPFRRNGITPSWRIPCSIIGVHAPTGARVRLEMHDMRRF